MTSLAQNILGDGDITGSMIKPETRTETYFSKMNCESILFFCTWLDIAIFALFNKSKRP